MVNTEWRVVENYNGYGKCFVLGMAELAFRIEDDGQTSGLFLAAASPQGGLPIGVSNYPALAKGDRGFPPSLVLGDFEELAHNNPAAGRLSVDLLAEATEVSGPLYSVSGALHGGTPGAPGAAIVTPSDYGTPQYGQSLSVAAGESTFELAYPKVAGIHRPGAISSAVGTTGEFTVTTFDVAAGTYNHDWTPLVQGNGIIQSTYAARIDLIARLASETSGDIVARGIAMTSTMTQPNLASGVETGTGIVAAGEAATVYVRTKYMGGSPLGYTASAATMRLHMLAVPV